MSALRRTDSGLFGTPYPKNFLWLLALATIPGALVGYFLEHQAETIFRNPLLIALTLSVVGYILYWADKRLRGRKNLQEISWSDAAIIGMAQSLAIVPGISRAGSTITAALLLGVDRVSAARFSFLLSTPIIFGATVLKLKSFFDAGVGMPEITGIVTAALTGYLAIASLIKFVGTVSYRVFFWYRLALALVIVGFGSLDDRCQSQSDASKSLLHPEEPMFLVPSDEQGLEAQRRVPRPPRPIALQFRSFKGEGVDEVLRTKVVGPLIVNS